MKTSVNLFVIALTSLFYVNSQAQYCAVACNLTDGQTQPSLIYQVDLSLPASSFSPNFQIQPGWFIEVSYLAGQDAGMCNEAANQITIDPPDYQQGDHDGYLIVGPGTYQNAPIPYGFQIPNEFVITSSENGQCAPDGTYVVSTDCNGPFGGIAPGDPFSSAYCNFAADNHFTLRLTDQDVYAIYDTYGNNGGNGYDEFLNALNIEVANACANCPVDIFSFIFAAEEDNYDLAVKLYNFDITNTCNVSFSGLPSFTSLSSPINLTGSPAGGTFSGSGVIFSAFNPSLSGPGIHDITYTYTDNTGCTASQTQSILVFTIVYNFVNYNLGTISPKVDMLPNLNEQLTHYNFDIIDIQGRLIYQSFVEFDQLTDNLAVPSLPKGSYIFRWYNTQELVSRKMVVLE